MRKHVFRQLVSDLNKRHGLEPTKHVGIDEAVAIFFYIYMISQGASYRNAIERFNIWGDNL